MLIKMNYQGIPVCITREQGQFLPDDTDLLGSGWPLVANFGYIEGTVDKDGDGIDCLVGDEGYSTTAYVFSLYEKDDASDYYDGIEAEALDSDGSQEEVNDQDQDNAMPEGVLDEPSRLEMSELVVCLGFTDLHHAKKAMSVLCDMDDVLQVSVVTISDLKDILEEGDGTLDEEDFVDCLVDNDEDDNQSGPVNPVQTVRLSAEGEEEVVGQTEIVSPQGLLRKEVSEEWIARRNTAAKNIKKKS